MFCEFKKMFPFIYFFVFLKVYIIKKTVPYLKNCSCFLEYLETSYLKIPSIERIERKSRLNNSWALSDIRWRNKSLKCPRLMNGKIADWFFHTRWNREAKRSFLCAHKILLAHIIVTYFKCILFFLPLQCTGICASPS